MSVSALSRILRNALFGSLTILLLATFAHATVATALDTPINWEKIGVIIGIITGIIGIIASIYGFFHWLRTTVQKWIDAAVEKSEAKSQSSLDGLRRNVEQGDAKSQRALDDLRRAVEQGDAKSLKALEDLRRDIVALLLKALMPAGPPAAPKQEAEAARDTFLDFLKGR